MDPNDINNKRLRFDWLIPALIHPRKTFQKIVEFEKPVWLTPLLLLSLLALLACVIAGPIQREAIINGASLPANFQYYTADQQAEFLSAQSSQSSFLFTFIFPIVKSLLQIWAGWFLLSIFLHLSLTLAGSRTQSLHSYNLVAWSMLPLAFRQIIQMAAMLFSHTLITNAGLSGFISGSGGAALLAGILAQIDIYFIWQIILLFIGVIPLSSLSRSKAWGGTALSLVVVILLSALPRLISSLLSGLSLGGLF